MCISTTPARRLFKQYNDGRPDLNVAYAIVVGILKREEVPADVLDALGRALAFYESLKERNELQEPEES